MKKPVEPTPEQFGLTRERIGQFSSPPEVLTNCFKGIIEYLNKLFSKAFKYRVSKAILFIAIGTLVAYLITKYGFGMLVVGGMFMLYWLAGIIFGLFLLFILVLEPIAKAIWKHRQPDLQLFNDYQTAFFRYKKQYSQWERMQPEWWQAGQMRYQRRFRYFVASELSHAGYKIEIGRQKSGYSISATKDKKTVLIKVSIAKNPIGIKALKDFGEVVKSRNADEGWFLSMSGFTENVYWECKPFCVNGIVDMMVRG